uniref:MOR2-PAG1_N domain-containing protein n=1 Tax=Panagrellus redivivus TaxID=6233 RepID=A0A7E4UWN9_PANRE
MSIDFSSLPAKFTIQNLLVELFSLFERKIQSVTADEPLDKLLNKSLRRCDDPYLDNLLRTLNSVSELCLPSVLEALVKWYEDQINSRQRDEGGHKSRSQKAVLFVNYLFCIVLIELLPQIQYFPTDCEQYVNYILNLSFKQISTRESAVYGDNYNNSIVVAETFAEVVGVLSQTHAKLVQKTFFSLLNEARKDSSTTPNAIANIISLLMAMKFYRIKTSQVSEIEQGVGFLDELASYYLEVDLKQKDLKHAIVGLLVEILLPVAAQIKTEANIPALIAFVDKLYGPTSELITKKQHKMAAYPLLTCLLCISQSTFFNRNWVQFLNATLSSLKSRDPKISRVALESLYRLLWVYIIRNNCDGNTATRSRLESICNSIFPRGSRYVMPRDAPLNIFVKIIHFIAQQKLDFAFKEIIFELLGCNRVSSRSSTVSIYPERMNIGIRALMVIADGLQQKDGPPGMPRTMAPIASGTIQRNRKTYLTRPLTADVARSIGLDQYYLPCRKAFDAILRTLDTQVGKPLMLTSSQTKNKEPEDIIGGEMKTKLDLFRTCIAAIPRLLPEPMPHHDLIDMIIRMTVHMDEELRQTAYLTLQNLITECVDWREDIVHTYINFLMHNIQDTFPALLESAVRFLLQLLCFWRNAVTQEKKKDIVVQPSAPAQSAHPSNASSDLTILNNGSNVIVATASVSNAKPGTSHLSPLMNNSSAIALHNIEGLALVLLCQHRSQGKKLAISLLREVKAMLALMENSVHDKPMLTVLDEATPYVINKYIEHVPLAERQTWSLDFASACDKICTVDTDENLVNSDKGNEYMNWDSWACALSGFCEYKFLPDQCPTAVSFAWPAVYMRLNLCTPIVETNNIQNENRASLLRSSRSKATASTLCGEALDHSSYLSQWQKYLVMSCALALPPSQPSSVLARSFSPNGNIDSLDLARSMSSSLRGAPRTATNISCVQLFQKISGMLRWENARDLRDSVALGIGSTNPKCFDYLLDELNTCGIIRELAERKLDSNLRRRKRKDFLRLQIVRILEIAMLRGLLQHSNLIDPQSGQLSNVVIDILTSLRLMLETDTDRDMGTLTSLRLHFAKTITLMVNSIPLERRKNLLPAERKRELMVLFFTWCGGAISNIERKHARDMGTYVELKAMNALCSMLCCGPMSDAYSPTCLKDEYLTRWIDMIFRSNRQTVQNICEDTLSTVLHLNDQNTALFEFVVTQCYTQPLKVSQRYFKSLVMLFAKREYPCDFISMLALCQVFAADNDINIRQSVGLLIRILRRKFLDDSNSANTSSIHGLEPVDEAPKDEDHGVVLRIKQPPVSEGPVFATSQAVTCRQLAQRYPSLTMPVFSDLFTRLKDARSDLQASILSALSYWIENIELVDLNIEIADPNPSNLASPERGYGSEEATHLVLNNLLAATLTIHSDHKFEIYQLWKTLATRYQANLPIIVQYLFVVMSLSPDQVIPVAKRIAQYLLTACGERFVSLLVSLLPLMTEQFKLTLARQEVAPYYRWQQAHVEDESLGSADNAPELEAKKEEVDGLVDDEETVPLDESETLPRDLPMPAYGGYYADMRHILVLPNQAIVHLSKSNLALFLLSELIGHDNELPVHWDNHATSILHLCVLYLDAVRPLVCRHARKALMNICLHYAPSNINAGQLASMLLNNNLDMERFEVIEKYSGTNDDVSIFFSNTSFAFQSRDDSTFSMVPTSEYRQMLLFSKEPFPSQDRLLQALIFCLSEKMDKPFWSNEEVGIRGWKIESADMLSCFVGHLASYLVSNLPGLYYRWTDISMSLALSVGNRHYAGRSFQVSAALSQNPTPWISKILSRLAEIVGDHNEETQCYITHMILCLMSLVSYVRVNLDDSERLAQSPSSPTGHNRSISYTPAFLSRQQTPGTPVVTGSQVVSPMKLSPNALTGSSPSPSKRDARHSMLIENEIHPNIVTSTPLNRSKSAATLKIDASSADDDGIGACVQLLSIAVAMLESHIDNEYLLALNLMDKIFDSAGRDLGICLQRLEKTIKQLDWCGFTGIIGLVSKGVLYSSGYETTISLLVKCAGLLNEPVIASSTGFPLIVTAILPYLTSNFDDPTPLCVAAAQSISKYCRNQLDELVKQTPDLARDDHPFNSLAVVMDQYRERNFHKDGSQWTKCVISYMYEAVVPNCVHLIVFLSEMLERCPQAMHAYLLHMINMFLLHGNFEDASPVPVNAQVIRIVSRHIQGVNSNNAQSIVKTIVNKWNVISINQVPVDEITKNKGKHKPKFELYVGNTTTSATNVAQGNGSAVGALGPPSSAVSPPTPRKCTTTSGLPGNNQPTSSASGSSVQQFSSSNADSLRRQNTTVQSKVRERLIGLLTASGMQVGLPKSASFIFSQSTTDLYHDGIVAAPMPGTNTGTLQAAASNSAYSSSERISHLDDLEAMSGSSLAAGNETSMSTDFPRVFKEFDFLEAEHDSISESTDSGFNWLSKIRPQRLLSGADDPEDGDDAGDDFLNPGEGDDEEDDDVNEAGTDMRGNAAGRSTLKKKRQRRPLSGASECNDISSDRTPVQSEKHSDDSSPSCPNSEDDDDDMDNEDEDDELEEMDEFKDQKSHRGASSLEDTASTTCPTGDDLMLQNLESASSIQCRSEFSAQNGSDYQSRKMPVYLECNHHSSGQIEQVWMSLVNEVASDQDGEMTAHCVLVFSQLFRECCVKLSGLLRDASHMVSISATTTSSGLLSPGSSAGSYAQRDVSGYFTHALDVLLKVADCPFLFVTAQFLRSANLLQAQRFSLYELREHYETFIERREQCIRALNSIKSMMKLLMIGGSTSSSSSFGSGGNLEIELCKCLHKLFFQLLQMLDKLHDMIKAIQGSPNAQEFDLSPAVLNLHRELLACIGDMPPSESRVSTTSLNVLPRGDQEVDTVILHMTNKQHKNAILALRQLRSQYGSEFGCCDHMDVDVLLVQFCRSHTLRTWAIVGSLNTLESSCTQLKETSMQFAALIRSLVSDVSNTSVRSSRLSSVNDSSFSAAPTATNTS